MRPLFFSRETLRAGAVKGLKVSNPLKDRPELILLLPFVVVVVVSRFT